MTDTPPRLTIGAAARASGVSAKMIRYYESAGLLKAPPRSEGGYRLYSESALATLVFIRHARDLGFSVEDIASLLDLWRDRTRASAEVKRLALLHIERLRARIAALDGMCRTLEGLACACPGDERPDCPILDRLAAPTATAPVLENSHARISPPSPARRPRHGGA
jgi:MerR family transcriptional regulator, copper efflux regulator